VLRFLKRVAVYFGVREDDVLASDEPIKQIPIKVIVPGALLAGALFAFVTAALDGFDGSLAGAIVRGALFGVLWSIPWLVIHHTRAGRERHAAGPISLPPSER
jgi:hypothetical protein